jgi:hypothetical protein
MTGALVSADSLVPVMPRYCHLRGLLLKGCVGVASILPPDAYSERIVS